MALIFDSFESLEGATKFAADVKENHDRDVTIYTNADEAGDAGFYPFQLEGAAVVLVDRDADRYDGEEAILVLVRSYGGRFAGT